MSSLSHSPPGKPADPACAWKYYILCSGGLTQDKSYQLWRAKEFQTLEFLNPEHDLESGGGEAWAQGGHAS